MRLLISAADIPEFNEGVVPLDKTAGTPVSVTFAVLAVMADACAVVIVVVLPALAVEAVVPIARLEVPAPMSVLISAADIFVLSDGVDPLDSTAGTPVSVTLAVLAVIAEACDEVIPVLAVFAVIALAWDEEIVVVSPAIAVVDVVPITKLEVPFPVPAPIKVRISAAEIPVFKLGVAPLLNTAGVPVSLTTPRLARAAEAVDAPVPPLATDKSVPDQFPLLIELRAANDPKLIQLTLVPVEESTWPEVPKSPSLSSTPAVRPTSFKNFIYYILLSYSLNQHSNAICRRCSK
jgi:hypothetical protein